MGRFPNILASEEKATNISGQKNVNRVDHLSTSLREKSTLVRGKDGAIPPIETGDNLIQMYR